MPYVGIGICDLNLMSRVKKQDAQFSNSEADVLVELCVMPRFHDCGGVGVLISFLGGLPSYTTDLSKLKGFKRFCEE